MRTVIAMAAACVLAFETPVSSFRPQLSSPHLHMPRTVVRSRVFMMSTPEAKPPTSGPSFSGALPIDKPETGGRTSTRRKQGESTVVDMVFLSEAEPHDQRVSVLNVLRWLSCCCPAATESKEAAYLDVEDEAAPSAPSQLVGDLLGDGGVVKTVVKEGYGALVSPGSEVTVNFEGRLLDGTVLCRGTDYKCIQGDGTMIGGWETAVGSMRVGEAAKVTIKPWYAYGTAGVAPVVGPDATLEFDIEVLDSAGNFINPRTFRDVDPKKLRDLQSITEDYAKRSELRMRNEEGLSNFEKAEKWVKSLYFFGFFEGETGERPPWYLTPTITFPAMFLTVAAAFYILISNGGVSIKRDLNQDELELGLSLLDQVWG